MKEIESLKQKLISSEKEQIANASELKTSRVKVGKLLQKVKNLQSQNETLSKEVEKLRAKKSGLSDLDQALEDEYRGQVTQAQTERDELKQRLEEVVREKDQMSTQCEVLKDAHDKMLEMKEHQDSEIRVLSKNNRELQSAASSMEWMDK